MSSLGAQTSRFDPFDEYSDATPFALTAHTVSACVG
jgi:hypothetical protein